MVVGAAAGALAEAMHEKFQIGGGGLTWTKTAGGAAIWELYRLREFMSADWPDFDRLARERGVAALQACARPLGGADMRIDEALKILPKVVADNLNLNG